MTPGRIQLRRTAGWRKPPDAVVVTRPHSKFANPYRIGHEATDAAEAVAMFGLYLLARPDLVAAAHRELRGRTLACWCRPGDPCHADGLLGVANADRPGRISPVYPHGAPADSPTWLRLYRSRES
jgi:hypothetical protein